VRVEKHGRYVKLWLSANDTYNWAHKAGASWPGSQLAGKRLFAEFQDGDLVSYTADGKTVDNMDLDEFDAITEDFLNKEAEKSWESQS
jgi:hypothetical protein